MVNLFTLKVFGRSQILPSCPLFTVAYVINLPSRSNHPSVRKAATHQIIAHALLAPAAIVHLHDRQASCAPAKRVPSVPPDARARGDATLRPRLALQVFLTMAAVGTSAQVCVARHVGCAKKGNSRW